MIKFTETLTDPIPARELQPDEYFNPSDHLPDIPAADPMQMPAGTL